MKDSDGISENFDEDLDEEVQDSQFDWLANIHLTKESTMVVRFVIL